jgi:phosphoglycolate phosphatase
MKFEAVLFDLDGTGFPGHDAEACKNFVGDGVEMFALRTLPENRRDEATVAQCATEMRAEYRKRWSLKTRPYDGIPELLDDLTLRNLKLAVLSNKPEESTREMVAELLSKWQFYPVAGALYLGDTGTDMKTARGAGMFPVGALWGFRTAEELKDTGAEVLVEHPSEVLQLL